MLFSQETLEHNQDVPTWDGTPFMDQNYRIMNKNLFEELDQGPGLTGRNSSIHTGIDSLRFTDLYVHHLGNQLWMSTYKRRSLTITAELQEHLLFPWFPLKHNNDKHIILLCFCDFLTSLRHFCWKSLTSLRPKTNLVASFSSMKWRRSQFLYRWLEDRSNTSQSLLTLKGFLIYFFIIRKKLKFKILQQN